MGNSGSSRLHHSNIPPMPPPPPPPPHGRSTHSQFVFAAATPYPSQYPNQYYPHYPGYYPPHAGPGTYGYHHVPAVGRYHPASSHPPPVPTYVEYQKAVTIRNDVNVKKETLSVEPDEENLGKFLVAFTFDATVSGSITVMFFGKENVDCNLIATKEGVFKQVTIPFQQGIGQMFRQPSGTGIDFSMFDETELTKANDTEVYPLIVKAEARPSDNNETETNPSGNSQITMAVFEKKEKGEWHAQVIKQILWVNGVRYELQEIYGIGNTAGGGVDENDSGKDCVICLSEPRDTTVLPCRHMCMCSECAKILQFQTNRCPICRQPVERLLEIRVNNGSDD